VPTRYLKPGICDSDRIEGIKNPHAETLYYRLLVNVDDFGRLDARPLVLKAKCYPIKQSATPEKISLWVKELHDANLIVHYLVNGSPYLQITKWDNKPRAESSRYPQIPTDAYNCIQLHTVAPLTVTVTETETAHAGFDEFWAIYPKKVARKDAVKAWKKITNDDYLKIMESLPVFKSSPDWMRDNGQYIPYPASWLNARRFEDQLPEQQAKKVAW
tara:strand:+ start:956 stop:1603 length:648 start_codon:yes stop_codon:yes gene_type:complete